MTRFAILPLALLAAACHRQAQAPAVGRAWVRLPAVAGRPGAAYFILNGGGAPERLVKIESALAQRVELHESMAGMGGAATRPGRAMATMRPLAGVDVPAGGRVAFAPGGRHAMLFGLDPVVKPGTSIPLRLGFADGRTAEAEAKTVAAGDDAPY